MVPILGIILLIFVIGTLYRSPQLPSDGLDYLRKFGNDKQASTGYESHKPTSLDDTPSYGQDGSSYADDSSPDPLHPDHAVANPNPLPGGDAHKAEHTTTSTSTTSRGVPATKTADASSEETGDPPKQEKVAFNYGEVHHADLTKPAWKPGDPKPDNYWTDAPRREVKSKLKSDGTYWKVDMRSYRGINPNVIPDPKYDDRYLIVAQQHQDTHENIVWHTEITCRAKFETNGDLKCVQEPMVLPIAMTRTDKCEGTDFPFITMNIGPHDARLFNGPDRPYVMWGAQSKYVCFGQWLQDYRPLVDWMANYTYASMPKNNDFEMATDLQRPPPYGQVEKNWFMFWDLDNVPYLHYHVYPRRIFARLHLDGSVGPDLAPVAYESDDKCWAKHIELAPVQDIQADDHLHQATNSLRIVMCKKNDKDCFPREDNTLLMTIFQHKVSRMFHAMYDPYVMLWEPKPPFRLKGMSKVPFWIHGRSDNITKPAHDIDLHAIADQSEQFYITSFNWKEVGRMYQGYLDDDVLIGFGIEDHQAAGIDVEMSELLGDYFTC
jgi:hypothetical protein